MWPEDVNRRALREPDVMDHRREQEQQRQQLRVAPPDHHAHRDHRRRDLSQQDPEPAEHQLDPVLPRRQHLGEGRLRVSPPHEERRDHVAHAPALAQHVHLQRQRHRHRGADQRAVAPEGARAHGAEPALGQHEAPQEDPGDEEGRPQVTPPGVVEREPQPQRARRRVPIPPGMNEADVAPAGDHAAEDVGLLEVVVVRVDDGDGQRDVCQRRQPAFQRAPQLAPEAIDEQRRQRHVKQRRQAQHPVRESEHLPEQGHVPEQAERVMHVIRGGPGQVVGVADDRQRGVPAPHVVGGHADRGDGREVSVRHRAGDAAQRDARREQHRRRRQRHPGERQRIRDSEANANGAQPIAEARGSGCPHSPSRRDAASSTRLEQEEGARARRAGCAALANARQLSDDGGDARAGAGRGGRPNAVAHRLGVVLLRAA